jgi:transglutaminase superfamily protein
LTNELGQTAERILRLITRGGRKVLRDPGEAMLILRMAIWVFILSILVKIQPLPRALRMVAPRTHGRLQHSREETERALSRAIDLLLGTDLFVFKPVCWKRAAILHRYLALNGVATRIVFGVRKGTDGEIAGHAWLETGGKPLLESTVPDYVVTYTFPSNEPFNLELGVLTADRT